MENCSETIVRQYVAKVIASEMFRDSPTLKDILRYLVDEEIEGRGDKLKAYTIGVDVFEKPEDFDAQADPIVRVAMVRVRKAIELYYATEGSDDPVIISVPKGAYRPVFRANPDLAAIPAEATSQPQQAPPTRNWRWPVLTSATAIPAIAIGLLVAGLLYAVRIAAREAQRT